MNLKQNYCSQIQTCLYEIETEDFYKDISEDVEAKFDTSNYAKSHPSGIPVGVNKKVIGMFKDECGGEIMQEFVGLRAKLYSYKMYEGDKTKKCKGVKSSVVKERDYFQRLQGLLIWRAGRWETDENHECHSKP